MTVHPLPIVPAPQPDDQPEALAKKARHILNVGGMANDALVYAVLSLGAEMRALRHAITDDGMEHDHKPCSHCGSRKFQVRTRECGSCGGSEQHACEVR